MVFAYKKIIKPYTILPQTTTETKKNDILFSPVVDFADVLPAALTLADPKSAKNTDKPSINLYCSFGICAFKSFM